MQLQELQFDSELFGFGVGRLDLVEDFTAEAIGAQLKKAHTDFDIKLVYLCLPCVDFITGNATAVVGSSTGAPKIPGYKVDAKATYTAKLSSFDKNKLVTLAYMGTHARAVVHKSILNDDAAAAEQGPSAPASAISPVLRELALASGEWSRFRIDTGIPRQVFEKMFEAWLRNSLNRSIADEVFLAVENESGQDDVVGFITVKLRSPGNEVNIGLLSVSNSHRRMGIASMLLSRAALWAIEKVGSNAATEVPFLSVVTQGANNAACCTYESFGFQLATMQDMYHAWLPQHLVEPGSLVSEAARIPFCRQYLTGNELRYAAEVIESGGLDSAGRFSIMCAERLRELLGGAQNSERVLITTSGTAALEMAALLCDLEVGDEVILPSYTFSSTANAFVLRGATLVFVDIRPDTLCIDELLIEKAITAKTRAICCVHYAGIPCEMDTICDIARRHNLFVIEDAAQALLSEYKGRPLGTIGHFGCFSFHFTKNVICGEGGAISINSNISIPTPSPATALGLGLGSRALIILEKGTNRYDFMAGKIDKYEWIDKGSSYVPCEIVCAVLWAQLEKCVEITEARRQNVALYEQAFAGTLPDVSRPAVPAHSKCNGHIFFIVLRSLEQRGRVADALRKDGISVMSHYVPLHSAPAGLKYGRVGQGSDLMPVTNTVFEGLLRLPVWVGIQPEEIQSIVAALKQVL